MTQMISKNASPVLTKMEIAVSHDGGNVMLHVGNSTLTMPYDCALQVATLLKVHGGQAKRWVGDTRSHIFAHSLLDDLETMTLREQKKAWA